MYMCMNVYVCIYNACRIYTDKRGTKKSYKFCSNSEFIYIYIYIICIYIYIYYIYIYVIYKN